MAQIQVDTESLKELIKEAVFEALEQQQARFYETATALIEDIGLAKAMVEVQAEEELSLEEAKAIAGVA